MRIDCRSDHALDTVVAATGKTFADWFGQIDAWGGAPLGRREISQRLLETHKIDPWWIATINVEYEHTRGLKEKDGRAKGYTICATKSIKAAASTCYDAFADVTMLDRWLGPDHRYFKVECDAGDTYIVRHNVDHDTWELTTFRAGTRK